MALQRSRTEQTEQRGSAAEGELGRFVGAQHLQAPAARRDGVGGERGNQSRPPGEPLQHSGPSVA